MPAHPYSRPDFLPDDDDTDTDTDSDRYTEMSLDASEASSRTSADLSMRSASPVPSVASVTSSLRAQAYRHEYGRGLNNYSDVYRLPADDEELDRLGPLNYSFFPSFPHIFKRQTACNVLQSNGKIPTPFAADYGGRWLRSQGYPRSWMRQRQLVSNIA